MGQRASRRLGRGVFVLSYRGVKKCCRLTSVLNSDGMSSGIKKLVLLGHNPETETSKWRISEKPSLECELNG
jgi:hypothetical protein